MPETLRAAVRVAIDGPAGAGKTSVARAVAEALGVECLDTGAMYRAAAAAVLRRGVDPADSPAVAGVVAEVAADIVVSGARVTLEGTDVSDEIRGAEVTAAVSAVAANPEVRAEMVARQQAWAEARGGCVMEGRDITTVVLPTAEVRVYLSAEAAVRARRRSGESGGSEETVGVALSARDHLDSTRTHAPLHRAKGVREIDTTHSAVESVVAEIMRMIQEAA